MNTVNKKKNEYESYSNQLRDKKQKLFEERKIEEWDLDPEVRRNYNLEELLANKTAIMKHMLPKETKESYKNIGTYGYYLNKLIDETCRVNERDYSKLRKILINYANNQSGIVKNVYIKI